MHVKTVNFNVILVCKHAHCVLQCLNALLCGCKFNALTVVIMFRVFSHIFLFPFYRSHSNCLRFVVTALLALVFTHHPRSLLLCRTYYFLQYPFLVFCLVPYLPGCVNKLRLVLQRIMLLDCSRYAYRTCMYFKCMRKTRKYCLLMEFHFLLNHPVYLKHLCNTFYQKDFNIAHTL